MIDILVCGIFGKMGNTLVSLLAESETARLVCGVDTKCGNIGGVQVFDSFEKVTERVDVIIDFSSPAALKAELDWATKHSVPVVIGSTGLESEHIKLIDKCAQSIAIFKTANFSIGINVLLKCVRETALALGDGFDIEIIEKHHRLKADAPSGTALMLAASAATENKDVLIGRGVHSGKRGDEIAIHSVRGGTIVGEHEVMFAGDDEIITLSHSARSKKVFAAGALRAAQFIVKMPVGKYDMQDML